MKYRRLITLALSVALLAGCSRVEPEIGGSQSEESDQVAFGGTTLATKGTIVTGTSGVTEFGVYSYIVDGEWDAAAKEDIGSFFTDYSASSYTPLIVSPSGSSWGYDADQIRYWPAASTGQSLTFYAFYPYDEITHSTDASTGKPIFSYSTSALANENEDLLCDVRYDMTKATTTDQSGVVDFTLEHALTMIKLQAMLIDSTSDDAVVDPDAAVEYDVMYTINGITLFGLYPNAELTISEDGGAAWSLDTSESSLIDLTAAQGQTLIPNVEGTDTENIYTLNRSSYTTITDDKALFVLPQSLSEKRENEGGTAPMVQVRVRKTYYNYPEAERATHNETEPTVIYYNSTKVEIPDTAGTEAGEEAWEKGEAILLSFTFDVAGDYDMPLTLESSVYSWTETDVEAEINPNVYIYATDGNIAVDYGENTADMYFYTNYEYDMRLARTKYELDGVTETTANGFTFYPYLYSDGSYQALTTSFAPALVDPDEDSILTYSYDDDLNLLIDGQTIPVYDGDGGGFYDLASFYVPSSEIEANGGNIPCYSYGSSYTGAMDDELDWLKFRITLSVDYSFDFYLALSTRQQLGLYTNSSLVESDAYGINKDGNDAVYILRIKIEDSHLVTQDGSGSAVAADADYGYLYGKIGAEMLSNGGGKITNKFNIVLEKALKDLTE